MTENQILFKELYIRDVVENRGEMSSQLLSLFDVVLEELNDDPEKMDTFIEEITHKSPFK